MPFRLLLPQTLLDAMIAQALTEAPNECCGLLAGLLQDGIGQVERIYPLVNAEASPVLYESDGRSMFDAYRDLTAHQLDILAVYHSHPTSLPVPSKLDLARNFSEDVVNLIVSLAVKPPLVCAWWLTATKYRPAKWEIV